MQNPFLGPLQDAIIESPLSRSRRSTPFGLNCRAGACQICFSALTSPNLQAWNPEAATPDSTPAEVPRCSLNLKLVDMAQGTVPPPGHVAASRRRFGDRVQGLVLGGLGFRVTGGSHQVRFQKKRVTGFRVWGFGAEGCLPCLKLR